MSNTKTYLLYQGNPVYCHCRKLPNKGSWEKNLKKLQSLFRKQTLLPSGNKPLFAIIYVCLSFCFPPSPTWWWAPPTAAKLFSRGRPEALKLTTKSNFLEEDRRCSSSSPQQAGCYLIWLTVYRASFPLICSLTHECYFMLCFSTVNQPQKNHSVTFSSSLASREGK